MSRVFLFGDGVNTDEIIPGRYNLTTDPVELGRHVFSEVRPGLAERIQRGDVIVAGANLGCGSSREHAPLALLGAGVACVVASSFARIFFRNAVNVGLPILECPGADRQLSEGEEVQLDLESGTVRSAETGVLLASRPMPPFVACIAQAGGLVEFLRDHDLEVQA